MVLWVKVPKGIQQLMAVCSQRGYSPAYGFCDNMSEMAPRRHPGSLTSKAVPGQG